MAARTAANLKRRASQVSKKSHSAIEGKEQDLREVFFLFNQEKKGKMGIGDLRVAFRVLGMELSREQIQSAQTVYSADGKHFTESEFMDLAEDIFEKRSEEDKKKSIDDAFQLMDSSSAGVLSAKQLARISAEVYQAGQIAAAPTEGLVQDPDVPAATTSTVDLFGGELSETDVMDMLGDLNVDDSVSGMSKQEFTRLLEDCGAFM